MGRRITQGQTRSTTPPTTSASEKDAGLLREAQTLTQGGYLEILRLGESRAG